RRSRLPLRREGDLPAGTPRVRHHPGTGDLPLPVRSVPAHRLRAGVCDRQARSGVLRPGGHLRHPRHLPRRRRGGGAPRPVRRRDLPLDRHGCTGRVLPWAPAARRRARHRPLTLTEHDTSRRAMTEKTEQELLAGVPNELFIGGAWRAAEGGETLEVRDPATGAVLRTIASASSADAQAAMDATADAFPAWSRTPARERGELLRRAFDLLTERAEDFALLMTLEMGKPLAESRGEVTYGGDFLRWFGEEAVRIQGGYGPNPENTGRAIVSRHPVGPCYLI